MQAWALLLGYFAYDSTYAEREYQRSIKKSEYDTIKAQWQVHHNDFMIYLLWIISWFVNMVMFLFAQLCFVELLLHLLISVSLNLCYSLWLLSDTDTTALDFWDLSQYLTYIIHGKRDLWDLLVLCTLCAKISYFLWHD